MSRKTVLKVLYGASSVLMIHHWDTDGIASAAILKSRLSAFNVKVSGYVPRIGIYGIDGIELDRLPRDIDLAVILDYSLDPDQLGRLAGAINADVAVVDHHIHAPPRGIPSYNPVAEGADPSSYPSTTWVLKELLGLEVNDLVILGIVGDVGTLMSDNLVRRQVLGFLLSREVTIEDYESAAAMIDSCYRALDRIGVAMSVDKLASYGGDPRKILSDPEWREKKRMVDEEVNRLVKRAGEGQEVIPGVIVYRLQSELLVLSAVGRALSRRYPDLIVVVVFELLGGPRYVYVRSQMKRLDWAIPKLKSLGFNIGGKDRVFSIQIDDGDVDTPLNRVLEILSRRLK